MARRHRKGTLSVTAAPTMSLSGSQHARTAVKAQIREHFIGHDPLQALVRSPYWVLTGANFNISEDAFVDKEARETAGSKRHSKSIDRLILVQPPQRRFANELHKSCVPLGRSDWLIEVEVPAKLGGGFCSQQAFGTAAYVAPVLGGPRLGT